MVLFGLRAWRHGFIRSLRALILSSLSVRKLVWVMAFFLYLTLFLLLAVAQGGGRGLSRRGAALFLGRSFSCGDRSSC